MTSDPRDGRVARIYLVTFVDVQDSAYVQVRVEQRDWMDRLLSRAQYSPLTHGGVEMCELRSLELRKLLIHDATRAVLPPDPPALGSHEAVDS